MLDSHQQALQKQSAIQGDQTVYNSGNKFCPMSGLCQEPKDYRSVLLLEQLPSKLRASPFTSLSPALMYHIGEAEWREDTHTYNRQSLTPSRLV